MNKKKTKTSVIISSIILMLVLVINIGLTFAWYTDHKEYSNNIDFGYIKIDVNNSETDGYFSNTDNYYNSIKPGDYLLRKDVKFNLKSGSDPAYIRAKYEVSANKNLFNKEDYLLKSNFVVANPYYYAPINLKPNAKYVVKIFRKNGYEGKDSYMLLSEKNNINYQWTAVSHSTNPNASSTNYVFSTGSDGKLYLGVMQGMTQAQIDTVWANTDIVILEQTNGQTGGHYNSTTSSYDSEYDKYSRYTQDEINVINYLKYKNLKLGENLLDMKNIYKKSGSIKSVNVTDNTLTVTSGVNGFIGYEIPVTVGETYTISVGDMSETPATNRSLFISNSSSQDTATYGTLNKNSSITITASADKLYVGRYVCYSIPSGSTEVTMTLKDLKVTKGTYHWSEKVGDYYYLLGSDNLPLAIDKTTDGYYTFLTKENSQINYDLEYDATNVNKNDINVNITIEAIQVPSVTKSITGDKGVEAVLNELNGITKPTDNYKVTFVYGDNQTAVTSNVAYGKDVSLPSAVTSLVSKGFSLWNGGLKIIGENGYNHSYIKDNKICNVTENLTLYQASEITLYNVTFKNGTDTIQTSKVINGKYAEYLGNKPTKTATDKVYTFIGWSKTENGEVVSLSNEKITQDTTFYAIFTDKPRTYKINYNLDGGVFTNTPTTTISTRENLLSFEDLPITTNGYYSQHSTNCKLEVGKTYTLSFDYNFSSYSSEAFGVGVGAGNGTKNSYLIDIIYQSNYSAFPQGRKVVTFTPTSTQLTNHEYLALRLVRAGSSVQVTANFSNFKLEEGAYATEYEPYGARNLPTNEDVYKEGYTLEGWYLDGAFTNEVTSLNGLTQDTTLYAKWVMATCGVETTSGKLYFDNLDDAFTYALTNNDSKVIIYKTREDDCIIGMPITIPTGKTLTIVSNGVMSNIGVHADIINNGTLIIGGKANSLNNLTFVVYNGYGIESSGNLTIYGGNFNRKETGKSLIVTTGGNLNIIGGTFEDLVVDTTNSFIKLANTVATINDATMENENTSSQKLMEVTENSVVTFDGETKLSNPYGGVIETPRDETKSNTTITINNGTFNGVLSIRANNTLTFNNGLIKQTHHALGIYNMGQFNMNGGELLSDYNTKLSYAYVYALSNYNGNAIINGGKITVNAYQSLSDLQYGYCAIISSGNITINNVNLTCDLKNTESRVVGIRLGGNKATVINNGNFVLKGVASSTGNYLIDNQSQNALNIQNGEFTNNINGLAFSDGTTNIYGGNFNVATSIYIYNNSNMNILGGTFTSQQNLFDLYTTGKLNIEDGTFTGGSDSANKLAVINIDSSATNVIININGGTYNGDYILLNKDANSVYNAKINKGILIAKNNAIYLVGSGATTTLNGGIIKTTNTENANAIYIEGGVLVLNNASITGNIYYETKDNLITVNGKLNGSYVINFKEELFDLGYEVVKFSNGISATTYKNNFSLTESMGEYILYPNTADDSLCLSRYFTVTFANDDGTVLKTEKVAYGDVPTYNGATPTKESDEMYVYTFSGWNQEFSKVTQDITYYAQYSVEPYYVTLPQATAFKNALTACCGFNYNTITSLAFSNSAPAGYTKGTSSITSGIDVYYNSSTKAVVIVTKGGILAPSDSSNLFMGFYALKEIKFNGILSTKNVTSMTGMFSGCANLEQLDLTSFETKNLKSISGIFNLCSRLKTVNMSNFIISADIYEDAALVDCQVLETIYAPKIIGDNTIILLPNGIVWGVEGTNTLITRVTKEVAGKKIVVSGYELTKGWQSQITWTEVGALTNGVQSITEISFEKTAPTGYSNSGKKINNIEIWANGTKIAFVSAKKIMAPANSSYLFSNTNTSYYLTNLTNISFNNFDIKMATNTAHMFTHCNSLTSLDLSTFDTSNVTVMNDMFTFCSLLTNINLTGKFTTSKVTALQYLFTGCSKLTNIDLSNFETNKATNFIGMFSGCSALKELDLSSFDFSSATNLSSMFNICSSLVNIKVDWSTTNNILTTTSSMFNGCSLLKQLDLKTLNTSGVTNFDNMFKNCSSLQDLDLSNFVISSTSTVSDMLTGATNIVRIIAPNIIETAITLPGTYYINGTGTGVTSITTSDAGKIFVNQKEST